MSSAPLLPEPSSSSRAKHSKFSVFYGADAYCEQLARKYEEFDELAALLKSSPDGGEDSAQFDAAAGKRLAQGPSDGKMLTLDVDEQKRSKVTSRSIPTPNIPDPMPPQLAFMFTKISPEQKIYMWNIYTLIFSLQCINVLSYWAMLKWGESYGVSFELATGLFGTAMIALCIQNVFILHDVIHGATFAPYEWQNYITHPFADFISLPWMDIIMEHNRHHNSTFDLLNHNEFGWDPANWLYTLQEWTFEWYGWFTVPLVPFWHMLGANDTGSVFAVLWWLNFPDSGPGGKCDKAFFSKWLPVRLKHCCFTLSLWGSIWLLGSYGLGRPLGEGWRFVLWVSLFCRIGFAGAWTVFANVNHSHWWNKFLATDPERTWPTLHGVMATMLGGRHRWNEMLFHDVHHMCPGRIGAMSQRGRFHGWQKVHDACVEILANGLWKSDDPETVMEQHQRKRSAAFRSRKVQ